MIALSPIIDPIFNSFLKLSVIYRVTVGMPVTRHPPYRSVHEELPHTAPTSGDNAENLFCVHHQDRSTQQPAPVCGPRRCSWCSPWSTPFPPPAPQRFSPPCSLVSQVLCCCPTSVSRSYQSYGISPSLVVPLYFEYPRKTHGSPDSRVKDVHTCQVLRLRRAVL